MILDTKKATLIDITYDIESPVPLHVDKEIFNQILRECFQIQAKPDNQIKAISLNEYIEKAPVNKLPIVNDVADFRQRYKGINLPGEFLTYFSKISNITDASIYRCIYIQIARH